MIPEAIDMTQSSTIPSLRSNRGALEELREMITSNERIMTQHIKKSKDYWEKIDHFAKV